MNILKSFIQNKKLQRLGFSPEEYQLLFFLRNTPATLSEICTFMKPLIPKETLLISTLEEFCSRLVTGLYYKGYMYFNEGLYSGTEMAIVMVTKIGLPVENPIRNKHLTKESCSSISILINSVMSLVFLYFSILCGFNALAAAGIIILVDTGVIIYSWHAIKSKQIPKAVIHIIITLSLLIVTLIFLSKEIIFKFLYVKRSLMATGLLIISGLVFFLLSRYQKKVAGRFHSFSMNFLTANSRRYAVISFFLLIAAMLSYFGIYMFDSIFSLLAAIYLTFYLVILIIQKLKSDQKDSNMLTVLSHWYEQRTKWNRERFFLSWLTRLLYEKPHTKSEILEVYDKQFRQKKTDLFQGIEIDITMDQYLENNLDIFLGHLLFDNKIHIVDDRFRNDGPSKFGN